MGGGPSSGVESAYAEGGGGKEQAGLGGVREVDICSGADRSKEDTSRKGMSSEAMK